MTETLSLPEPVPTNDAAAEVGVGVSKFHRLVGELGLVPVVKAPGLRGAMFWTPDQIAQIKAHLAAEVTS